MNPKISIIVPVYKVEKFLSKCINSILVQTMTDFELILINDGSPDKCGDICEEYAMLDKRIKVIHKKNEGVSSARNIGLDLATGEYIGFVDSDDFIHEEMYEALYECALKQSADLVMVDLHKVDEEKIMYINNSSISKETNVQNFTNKEALESLYTVNHDVFVYCTNKLYKKELFKNLRFPIDRLYQDEAIAHYILYRCKKISYIQRELYYYVQRSGSAINSNFSIKRFDKLYAHEDRIQFLRELNDRKLMNQALKVYMDFFLWNYFFARYHLSGIKSPLKKMKKMFDKHLYYFMKNPLITGKQKIMLIMFRFNPIFYGLFIKIKN